MSTAQVTSNKAAFRRLHDAMNTGEAELISRAIDEVVEPDVLIRTPLPVGGRPMYSPRCVPVTVFLLTTLSPSAIKSSTVT